MMPDGHHSDSDSTLLPLPKSAITWFGGIFARLPPLAAGLHVCRRHAVIHCVQACGWGELATERVEACVDEMSSWMRKNKLQLNNSKTEVMIICSVHNHSKVNIPHIQVGDSEIQPVSVVRNIGAQLDETLSIRSHVNSAAGRTSTCGTSPR